MSEPIHSTDRAEMAGGRMGAGVSPGPLFAGEVGSAP